MPYWHGPDNPGIGLYLWFDVSHLSQDSQWENRYPAPQTNYPHYTGTSPSAITMPSFIKDIEWWSNGSEFIQFYAEDFFDDQGALVGRTRIEPPTPWFIRYWTPSQGAVKREVMTTVIFMDANGHEVVRKSELAVSEIRGYEPIPVEGLEHECGIHTVLTLTGYPQFHYWLSENVPVQGGGVQPGIRFVVSYDQNTGQYSGALIPEWRKHPPYAQFISQSVPPTMTAGQQYTVSITMKNNGIATWNAASGYRLGSQTLQDNTTWGINRANLPPTKLQVLPGEQVTFTFTVTAPSPPGTYNFQWKMLQEGVQWFGDSSQNVPIQVTSIPAPPGPTLSSLTPATAVNGEIITFVFNGEHFKEGATVRVYYPAGTHLYDTAPSSPSGQPQYVSSQEIRWGPFSPLATAPGTYELQIINPDGQLSSLQPFVVPGSNLSSPIGCGFLGKVTSVDT
jgi:hypothetical protein